VDDLLNEQEQWEQVKAWFRENGVWIAAGVLVAALGAGGWRFYQDHVEQRALAAVTQYEALMQAYDRDDSARAATLLADLERDHAGSPYVDQAHLAAARLAVESNDLPKAATLLRGVMESTRDPELGLVARLRLARVQLAQGKPDDALTTLRPVEPASAFAPAAAEIRGDALLAKADRQGALKAYREASAAKTAGIVDTATLDLKIRDLASP